MTGREEDHVDVRTPLLRQEGEKEVGGEPGEKGLEVGEGEIDYWTHEFPLFWDENCTGKHNVLVNFLISALALEVHSKAGSIKHALSVFKRAVVFVLVIAAFTYHFYMDTFEQDSKLETLLNQGLTVFRFLQVAVSWYFAYIYIRRPSPKAGTDVEKAGPQGRLCKTGMCHATDMYNFKLTNLFTFLLFAVAVLSTSFDFFWNYKRVSFMTASYLAAALTTDTIANLHSCLFWCIIMLKVMGVAQRIYQLVPQVRHSSTLELAVRRHQAVTDYMKSTSKNLTYWMSFVVGTNFCIVFLNLVNWGFGGSIADIKKASHKLLSGDSKSQLAGGSGLVALVLPFVLYTFVLYIWRRDFVRPVNETKHQDLPEGSCLKERANVFYVISYHDRLKQSYGKALAMRIGWFPIDLNVAMVGSVAAGAFVAVKIYLDYFHNTAKATL